MGVADEFLSRILDGTPPPHYSRHDWIRWTVAIVILGLARLETLIREGKGSKLPWRRWTMRSIKSEETEVMLAMDLVGAMNLTQPQPFCTVPPPTP